MTALKEIPKGYMKDAQGRLVPVKKVNPIDKERNDIVKAIVGEALNLSGVIGDFKHRSMDAIKGFVQQSGKQYGVKLGGVKGNIQLVSYDGEYKILIAVAESFFFDERLQAAKALIDECIRDWSKGVNPNIMLLINEAFKVDKQGKINVKNVLMLKNLDIKDTKWKKAMKAIQDALQVSGSKEYIRIYRRNTDGGYDHVNLDISAL